MLNHPWLRQQLILGVRLPQTGELAVPMPGVTPSGYNLGKQGWFTAQYPSDSFAALDMLMEGIEEGYRVVAPKRLVGQLDRAQQEDKRQ